MRHRSPHPTVTPLPPPHSDFRLLMHRLDEHAADIHELRSDVRELKASIDAVRIESRDQADALRIESRDQVDALRRDSQQQLDAFRRECQQQLDAFRRETQQGLQELRVEIASSVRSSVAAAIAPIEERFNTLDERVKSAGLASDTRLLKWFAGSAASSSGLAILVSRLLS
ncbi:hypothetical protein CS062_19965 [Roseateles chitinivorans]|jgi:F0F1-type ATP synthase membrane subunit b/b'|uniref:Uncharacterized protein n=1 Tax=Roseateles chitinivorans TaxID=2917965 RepID=A0A2G9C4S2_9BURK|nr:hypothetical protein [Roseateles chitinivorans]PIM51440.1 hypothetical protein CS062_19965 [Roseateles chitinivorans]